MSSVSLAGLPTTPEISADFGLECFGSMAAAADCFPTVCACVLGLMSRFRQDKHFDVRPFPVKA